MNEVQKGNISNNRKNYSRLFQDYFKIISRLIGLKILEEESEKTNTNVVYKLF